MANFKIKVEALNPEMEVDENLKNGVECEGFFLCADQGKEQTVHIEHMSIMDIARHIAADTNLMQAAFIAHGIEEARLVKENRTKPKTSDLLVALLKQ